MKQAFRSIYYFLPVQLLLLHARKYQLLLGFWVILFLVVTGHLASTFGASSLFLAPEYLGHINFLSMFLLGCSLCVFIMMWHITTFIVHSKRIPFMGATRHAFVIYCINNSVIPGAFLAAYSIIAIRFQWYDERAPIKTILLLQLGFYFGIVVIAVISFAYFFRVGRDYFKTFFSSLANPSRIREIIPKDYLDLEPDILPAEYYLSGRLRVSRCADLEPYHPRVMNTILRRHHRNVIFAALVAYLLLLLMGAFADQPMFRVPAGAGFLLLFAIIMGIVGAFKYFMRSWETLGWILLFVGIAICVHYRLVDLRSIAYGLNYKTEETKRPAYTYEQLRNVFSAQRYMADRSVEMVRLDKWKSRATSNGKPPLLIVTASGGGSRASYWTFHVLQYLDSVSHGAVFRNTVLMTGASGGMIGAAYWRSVHDANQQGLINQPYSPTYRENIGKDLLNAIIFSVASVDLISPFNKITIGGYSYSRDRGYAMEQEMIRNTEGLLDKNIGYFKTREANGEIPMLIVNGTIVNDGRKLMVGAQPLTYLTQPASSVNDTTPPIDAVDFATLFWQQDPYNLRLTSALRMTATFPFVLPVIKYPSEPLMNVMDAGLRDNFGLELSTRYLYSLREWIEKNTSEVIVLCIRDTRESAISGNSEQSSLTAQLTDPLFAIHNKWEAFQSYGQGALKEYAPWFLGGKVRFVKFEYVPRELNKAVALNFHLTQAERQDIYQSIFYPANQASADTVLRALGTR